MKENKISSALLNDLSLGAFHLGDLSKFGSQLFNRFTMNLNKSSTISRDFAEACQRLSI